MKFAFNDNAAGIAPAIEDRKLAENFATISENVKFDDARIRPIKENTTIEAVTATTNTIYNYNGTWERYDDICDLVKSPVVEDQFDRVYRTSPSDGDLKVFGTFAERDLQVETPGAISSITKETAVNVEGSSLAWYNGSAVACGNPKGIVWHSDSSVTLTYAFPGTDSIRSYFACTAGPTLQLTFGGLKIPTGSQACGTNIVTAAGVDITYNSTVINVINVSAVSGPYADYTKSNSATGSTYASMTAVQTVVVMTYSGTYPFDVGDIVRIDDEFISLDSFASGTSTTVTYNITRGVLGTTGVTHSVGTLIYDDLINFPACDIAVTCYLEIPFPSPSNFYYCCTFIDDADQESSPSDPTEIQTREGGEVMLLTGLPTTSDPTIVTRRLYRVATLSDTSAVWKKVVDLPKATTTYRDYVADSLLGIDLGAYGDPPEDIDHLVVHPCGSLIGAKDRTVYASEPLIPNAWPSQYKWTISSDIVGLAIQGNDVVVLTEDHPNILTGSHPDNFAREELLINQSCTSKRSICKLDQTVVYASPDGLVALSGASAQVITKGILDKEWIDTYNLDTAIAESYDGVLYVYTSNIAFSYDKGKISTFTDTIRGLHRVTADDILYLIDDATNNIVGFQQSATNRTLTWKSKLFHYERPVTFSVGQIIADDYDTLTFNVYNDSTLVDTVSVADFEAFRLSMMRPERDWNFEVVSNNGIIEFQAGTSVEDLRN